VRDLRIGICEDDAELRSVLTRALTDEGFEVRPVAGGRQAVQAFSAEPPDLLVLDIGLPDADGRDVCQALRAHGVDAPVIFLTARGDLTDRLAGFHAGGDDYLTKPFALAELLVRVHALLRRTEAGDGGDGDGAAARGVVLDPVAHAIVAGEERAMLTPTEFRLLAALAARRGGVLRRAELVAAAWPQGAIVHDNTLDAYIARIRRKLRDLGAPEALETVRGVGYVLR
jgi:two-component system response regulator MprA